MSEEEKIPGILDQKELMDPNKGDNHVRWKPEYTDILCGMAAAGATDHEMACFVGVRVRTIRLWRKQRPELQNALDVGFDHADKRVKRALFERAVGYDHEETKVMQHQGSVIEHEIIKHVPPDVAAIRLWLINRNPEEWSDRKDHNYNLPDGLLDALVQAEERYKRNVIDVESTDAVGTESDAGLQRTEEET